MSGVSKISNLKCVYCYEPASFTVSTPATKLYYCDSCYFSGKAPKGTPDKPVAVYGDINPAKLLSDIMDFQEKNNV